MFRAIAVIALFAALAAVTHSGSSPIGTALASAPAKKHHPKKHHKQHKKKTTCDPNYKGACLDPHASDYDCAGGSGNGPKYTGRVTVIGDDHFDLDRDGDGIGCETS
jgi:hypothetical protein